MRAEKVKPVLTVVEGEAVDLETSGVEFRDSLGATLDAIKKIKRDHPDIGRIYVYERDYQRLIDDSESFSNKLGRTVNRYTFTAGRTLIESLKEEDV